MVNPQFTALERQIMKLFWRLGPVSIREIVDAFPDKGKSAYTTIQTTIYRLEAKNALRRTKKIGNAHIFESVISPEAEQGRLIDELLSLFGGRTQPVMSRLIESGKLTLEDIQEAEKTFRKLSKREKPE